MTFYLVYANNISIMESENRNQPNQSRAEQWQLDPPKLPDNETEIGREASNTRANRSKGMGKLTVSAVMDLASDVSKTTDKTPEGQFQLPTMDNVALPPRPNAMTQAMKETPLPPRPEK